MFFTARIVSASALGLGLFEALALSDCAVALAVNSEALNKMSMPDKIALRPINEARFLQITCWNNNVYLILGNTKHNTVR